MNNVICAEQQPKPFFIQSVIIDYGSRSYQLYLYNGDVAFVAWETLESVPGVALDYFVLGLSKWKNATKFDGSSPYACPSPAGEQAVASVLARNEKHAEEYRQQKQRREASLTARRREQWILKKSIAVMDSLLVVLVWLVIFSAVVNILGVVL